MKSTLKATLLLIATFAGGALAGGTVVALAERGDHPALGRERHHRGKGEHLNFLTDRLKLTTAQRDSVEAILARHKPAMDSIWSKFGPRFETIKDSISNDIRRQLTPEQQTAYTEIIRRFELERRGADDK